MISEIDFQYCPKCKGTFEKQNDHELVCTNCNLHYFVNPRPTNGVIFENEKGEILLVRRKFNPGKNLLDIPGGFIDVGEDWEESVIREIQEELGITLKDFRYFKSYENPYEFGGVIYQTICFIAVSTLPQNQIPTAKDDALEIVYVNKREIPMDQIAFNAVKRALRDYIAQ